MFAVTLSQPAVTASRARLDRREGSVIHSVGATRATLDQGVGSAIAWAGLPPHRSDSFDAASDAGRRSGRRSVGRTLKGWTMTTLAGPTDGGLLCLEAA